MGALRNVMMAAALAAGVMGAGSAQAYWDRGYGGPRYYAPPPPVYYAPRPVYVPPPPPVYYAPRPVYVPPPVYYAPRPYYGPRWGHPGRGHGRGPRHW